MRNGERVTLNGNPSGPSVLGRVYVEGLSCGHDWARDPSEGVEVCTRCGARCVRDPETGSVVRYAVAWEAI